MDFDFEFYCFIMFMGKRCMRKGFTDTRERVKLMWNWDQGIYIALIFSENRPVSETLACS